jgi:hypothetical protein
MQCSTVRGLEVCLTVDVVETAIRARNQPRGRVLRVAITVVLWLTAVGCGPLIVELAVVDPVLLHLLSGDAEVLARAQEATAVVLLVSQFAVFAWLCPKVSYRWFDCLMLAIPIAGQLIWAPRILWRIAYLPYRDWQPRPDEARGRVRISNPTSVGQLPIYDARARHLIDRRIEEAE